MRSQRLVVPARVPELPMGSGERIPARALCCARIAVISMRYVGDGAPS